MISFILLRCCGIVLLMCLVIHFLRCCAHVTTLRLCALIISIRCYVVIVIVVRRCVTVSIRFVFFSGAVFLVFSDVDLYYFPDAVFSLISGSYFSCCDRILCQVPGFLISPGPAFVLLFRCFAHTCFRSVFIAIRYCVSFTRKHRDGVVQLA